VRGRSAEALTALRTSSSLKTLQEQTIKVVFRVLPSSIVKAQAPGKAKRFNFKIFQTALVKSRPIWNKSKQLVASRALIQITADASVAEWCRAARWDLDAATASSVSAATISGTAIGIAAAVEVAAAVVAMIEVAAVPAVAAVNVAAA
jgi:hypothetical protein